MKHRHPDYNADTDLGDRPPTLTQQRDERCKRKASRKKRNLSAIPDQVSRTLNTNNQSIMKHVISHNWSSKRVILFRITAVLKVETDMIIIIAVSLMETSCDTSDNMFRPSKLKLLFLLKKVDDI